MIKEMACPECGAGDGIEVFERDGLTVGDSVCCQCGFTIPEGKRRMRKKHGHQPAGESSGKAGKRSAGDRFG